MTASSPFIYGGIDAIWFYWSNIRTNSDDLVITELDVAVRLWVQRPSPSMQTNQQVIPHSGMPGPPSP